MKTHADITKKTKTCRSPWKRGAKWAAWFVAGIVLLIVALLSAATLYLTPKRLTGYFNTYASQYLNADIHAKKIDFTIWSSFPRLCLQIDSLTVVSHSLDSVPAEIAARLPDDADSLCSIAHLSGSVNTIKAISNKWYFSDLLATGVSLNLVQATDSAANWNIVKPDTTKTKIPYFTIKKAQLKDVRQISYTSLTTAIVGKGDIKDLTITRSDSSLNDYKVNIKGDLTTLVDNFPVIKNRHFYIAGNASLRFQPFGASFSDFVLNLQDVGTIKLGLDMDGEKNSKINLLNFRLNAFDLMAIWEYVSQRYFPEFKDIVTDFDIESDISLSEPYPLDSNGNPDIDISIKRLHIAGKEFDMDASAQVADILGNPDVTSAMRGDVELAFLEKYIPALTGWNLEGKADADLNVNFNLRLEPTVNVSDINLNGRLLANTISCSSASDSLSMTGKKADIKISSHADCLDVASLKNAGLNFSMTLQQASLEMPAFTADINGVTAVGNMKGPRPKSKNPTGYPTWVHLDAARARMAFPGDASNLRISNFKLKASWDTLTNSNIGQPLDVATSGDSLSLQTPSSTFRLNKFLINLKSMQALTKHQTTKSNNYRHPSRWIDSIPHKEAYLFVDAPKGLINLMGRYDIALSVQAQNGVFLNNAFPAANYLSAVNLKADFDSVELRRVTVSSQSTKMSLSGKIKNLRQWLLHDKATPLWMDLNLAVDTLDFNQIARTYERGNKLTGKSTAQPKEAVLTPGDTLSMLVPRNLHLNLNASAKATKYTNLNLYDLSTRLLVDDGNLNLDSLKISASFGHATISARYNTRNIEKMNMWAAMSLDDIDVVKFFEKYHTLLEMMPQMKNLSGVVGLKGEVSANIFPNMDVDVSSMTAKVAASGEHLLVHQNRFIRNITRMMLIPNDNDLKIKNIYATASVHDNLLELNPFDVEFSKYKIRMMGINDFQGHLNYHVSVLKMPIPLLRFGINIRGDYHSPHFSFGRHYNVENTQNRMVIYNTEKINMVSEMKYFLNKFIHNAAAE